MKSLKGMFGYVLNINTIWGWMIVAAFLFSLVQHYRPTTTSAKLEAWRAGVNEVTFTVTDPKDRVIQASYEIQKLGADGYAAIEKAPSEPTSRPYPLALVPAGEASGWRLIWNAGTKGEYSIRMGAVSQNGTLADESQSIVINARDIREGVNEIFVTVTPDELPPVSSRFMLAKRNSTILFQRFNVDQSTPYLINVSTDAKAGTVRFVWDCKGEGTYAKIYGKYTTALNGAAFGKGKLVTLQAMTDAAFTYAKTAFDIGLGLVAAMVLFLGLMKVAEEAGIVQIAARVFRPIINFMFPGIPKDHPANGALLMNMTTTVLGLGNAATPFGLKAIMELQSINPHKKVASDAMVMLVGYNTAGFAILPTTLLAVRQSAGCSNPFEIIGPCMLAGLTSTIVAILAVKGFNKLPIFKLEAALAEGGAEDEPAANATETEKEKKA